MGSESGDTLRIHAFWQSYRYRNRISQHFFSLKNLWL